ncbi:MAG: hypothetical protein KDA21_09370, partial [Phycisphaerales bacterium]|nr:hypothetical protein [Phycisphaerales bacterium]
TVLVLTWIRKEIRHRNRAVRRPNYSAKSLESLYVTASDELADLRSVLGFDDHARRTSQAYRCPLDEIDLADSVACLLNVLWPDDRDLLMYVVRHGVSNTAREWARRTGRPVSRHRIQVRLARITHQLEKAGLLED